MSLSLAEIRRAVDEMQPLLVGGRLQTAAQPAATTLVLTFYARGARRHVLIAAEPRFARLHLVGERPRGTGQVPPFARSLRQGLRGRSLWSLEAAPDDRVVTLAFGQPEESAGRLIAELTGRTSNVYHVGPTGRILASLRAVGKSSRALRPGSPYEPPPAPPVPPAAAADRFTEAQGPAPAYSAAIEQFYAELEAQEAVRALRDSLSAHLRAARKKALRLLAKLEGELEAAADAEELRLCGELLKIHLARVPPRARSITVANLFEPGSPDVTVALLPNLSPRQNLERYFQRYKKRRATREHLVRRAAETRQRIDWLDSRALPVQSARTPGELEALAAELGRPKRSPAQRRKEPRRASGPKRFVSADGLEILVGRTHEENDALTFRMARGNDLWLHVEGYTGSHVVVRAPRGKSVPNETLLDAATLAVRFSQLRRAGGGPVAYCACKHVSKPRGAGPGQVLYSQSKTLHVTVERSRLDRLLGRTGGPP